MEQLTNTEQGQTLTTPESSPAPAPVEKMVPQSKVDEIVRHANARVAEKTRQEVESRYQAQQPAAPTQPTYAPAPTGAAIGGMQGDIQSMIANQVQQTFQQKEQQYAQQNQIEYANRIQRDFESRLDAGKDSYPDFDDVTKSFPFVSFPLSVLTSMNFENTADIMYEAAKNPTKLKNLEDMARVDAENARIGISSNLAYREMQKLAESIRINKQAGNVKTANSPLSQIQPSPGGIDNGSIQNATVSDLRKAAFIRRRR